MSSLADVVLVTLNYRWAPPGRSHAHRYLLLFLSICMLVGAARPFGASRARRSAWFAWPARASTLTIRAPVFARAHWVPRAALACWFPRGTRLYVARWLHRRCVVHDMLRCIMICALRVASCAGSGCSASSRTRRCASAARAAAPATSASRCVGRVSPAWQLLRGVLTAYTQRAHAGCSRRSKWSRKKGVLAGYSTQRHSRRGGAWQDQRLALQWVQENIHAFGGASRPEYSRRPQVPKYCGPCIDCNVPAMQCPLHSHQRNHVPSVRGTASSTLSTPAQPWYPVSTLLCAWEDLPTAPDGIR
jgi:hypothetical protein